MNVLPLLTAFLLTVIGSLRAQDNVSVVAPIDDISASANGSVPAINLTGHFQVAGISSNNTVVRFDTKLGVFNAELFRSTAPNTVSNFLRYVDEARFTDTIIHRSDSSNQVIQGGGFMAEAGFPRITRLRNCGTTSGSTTVTCEDTSRAAVGMTVNGSGIASGATIASIESATSFVMSAAATSTESGVTLAVAYPAIPLETAITTLNARGTLGMARTSDPNSATSEWFVNTGDNSTNFPPASSSGGYAVFGRVTGTGMSVVDAIAALPIASALASPFSQLPFTGDPPPPNPDGSNLSKLVVVNSVVSGPVFPSSNGQASYVRFSVKNTNPGLVTATLNGSTLNLSIAANRGGTATLEVVATDGDGRTASIPFAVTVAGWTDGDLSGDGIDDLVFQNDDGQIYFWRMTGTGNDVASGEWISTGSFGSSKVVARSDLDGDGIDDLVLQNPAGEVHAVFLDSNAQQTEVRQLSQTGFGDWRIVGMADMNRDGTDEMIIQSSTGRLGSALLDGNGDVSSTGWIYEGELGSWKAVAVADMDSDGIEDIVFQSDKGQIFTWLMDGSTSKVNPENGEGLKAGTGYVFGGALGDWKVSTVADLNNDGIPDIIFQNSNDRIFSWLMDGTGSPVDPTTGRGLKPGSGYLSPGGFGNWKVR